MKYATYKYSVKVTNTKTNKTVYSNYYGYKTRKEAEEIANRYRAIGYKAEVVKEG